MRSVASVAAAIVGTTAVWLSFAGVTLVTHAVSPRLALTAPFWLLVIFIIAAVLWVWRTRPAIATVVPIFLGLLLLLPFLPDVPPVALVWAGPTAVLVLTAIALGVLYARGVSLPERARTWLTNPRHATLLAGVLAFSVFLFAAWSFGSSIPSGDEPDYLIITQSLLTDGDLRIENNHRQGDYEAYTSRQLPPAFLRRGMNGEIYSVHAPGLPTLLVPGFYLAGYRGAIATVALVVALGSALSWMLAFEVTRRADAAWIGWLGTTLSIPVLMPGFTIFPDGPAAAIVVAGVYALFRPDSFSTLGWLGVGAALAVLPWLHTRYALLAAVMGVLISLRLVRRARVREIAAFYAIPILSAAGWLAYFWHIYGTPNPSAPYGSYTQTAWRHVPVGLLGLVFDQQFGLFVNAPIFVFAGIGLVSLCRGRSGEPHDVSARRWLAAGLVAMLVPYAATVGAYRMWWGGYSGPARFLVPTLLAMSTAIAWCWSQTRNRVTRAWMIAALTLTLFISAAIVTVGHGTLAFNMRQEMGVRWVRWVSPLVDATLGLPSIHRDPLWPATEDALVWVGTLVVMWALTRGVSAASRGAMALTVSLATALAGMVGLSAVWRRHGRDPLVETSAQVRWLHGVDAPLRTHAVMIDAPDGKAIRSIRLREALAFLRVGSPMSPPDVDAPLLTIERLPAGRYALHASRAVPGGRLFVSVDRWEVGTYAYEPDLARATSGRAVAEVFLPADPEILKVFGSKEAVREGVKVWLTPIEVPPAFARVAPVYLRTARRYGPVLAYFLDRWSFPEPTGYWVRAERPSTSAFVVERPRGSSLQVTLRNGAAPNRVTVQVGGARRTLTLAPSQEAPIDVPLRPDGVSAPLTIFPEHGFVPAKLDPSSDDQRSLGVWIEIRQR
jgi:hypothetical protein